MSVIVYNIFLTFSLVFIRRDLREDMQEFIKKHDDEERQKSKRRMSNMTEAEKRRTSIKYRRESSVTSPSKSAMVIGGNNNTGDIPIDIAYTADSNGKIPQNNRSGSPSVNMMQPIGEDNEAYQKEIPVYYKNGKE